MSYKTVADSSQLKFAEKLVILNDRAVGMLTRIYNMKKACADPKSQPQFLNDKTLESAISYIVKRFPVIDIKRNSTVYSSINDMKGNIIKKLSLYYYTFVDLLDLKDAILQLFTAMDANQCRLNINQNLDLTTSFLNLVVNFCSLMVLLSRVDDRKTVLGLYAAAYDILHTGSETSFPRLGQMIVDYEQPFKKLSEDLGLSYRVISSALESLKETYFRRNISAEQQRDSAMISLTANPRHMLYAAQTNTIACEYMSLDTMDRWIIFGVSLCPRLLSDPSLLQLFQKAMQHSLAVRLFRDETIFTFSMISTVLEPLKNQNKLLNELKEINILAIQTCGHLHAHRRHFLRMALKELYLLLVDEPGLLGPKILFVWMGLSMARDEIQWLLRHYDVWQQLLLQYSPANKKAIQKSGLQNIVVDKFLPELLYYLTEIRNLVLKNSDLISSYYIQYIAGYDAPLLTELSQRFSGGSGLSEYEQLLIHSCIQALANISDGIDSRGVHLDWFRFQALTSIGRSTFKLQVHANFAVAMNTALFHLKHIGNGLDELLRETSDLSIYCFYPRIFDLHLRNCLDFPLQSRFSITFAHICAHFNSPLHELCPEENDTIIEKEISRKIVDIFSKVCADGQQLVLSTEPRACANMFALEFQGKNEMKMPGFESIRQSGQPISSNDSNNLYLGELCQALATTKELNISGHIFVPREFLFHQLEKYLNTSLLRYIHLNNEQQQQQPLECPRRPSEMLAFLSAQLNALQHLDIFYNFDLTRLFNDTLLQQSQREDAQGNETLAEIYSKWYLEVLLRKASTCHLLYSEHMQSFVNNPSLDTPVNNTNSSTQLFRAERFTDPRELRSLSQIIGPFGIKFMEEKLVWHIASQITELFKIVREHNEQLHIARVNYDKPEKLKEIVTSLSTSLDSPSGSGHKNEKRSTNTTHGISPLDSMLQRVIIIGEICAFRDMLFSALNDVLKQRAPFLINSLSSLINSPLDELQKINIGEACAASGFKLDVDLALANAIKQQANTNGLDDPNEHYKISCLLIVFIAISLPHLALNPQSCYKASLSVTKNNSHTIPLAVNTITGALFFLHQRGDTAERMHEFLA
uniref:Uncharacterized protein n=1 Tax=Meloidogyne enterolobii TaxID=390850 RepID=A0A6V7Y0N0_MELEN|nr:unnamed protein product [Meloidogyne enterolobii]